MNDSFLANHLISEDEENTVFAHAHVLKVTFKMSNVNELLVFQLVEAYLSAVGPVAQESNTLRKLVSIPCQECI